MRRSKPLSKVGSAAVVKVRTWVPVSREMIADTPPLVVTWMALAFLRNLTARSFGEEWSNAERELERLEHSRTLPWDAPDLDEEEYA